MAPRENEFISWREFTSDIWLIGQEDNESAKKIWIEFSFVAIDNRHSNKVRQVGSFVLWNFNKENF